MNFILHKKIPRSFDFDVFFISAVFDPELFISYVIDFLVKDYAVKGIAIKSSCYDWLCSDWFGSDWLYIDEICRGGLFKGVQNVCVYIDALCLEGIICFAFGEIIKKVYNSL